MCCTDMSPEIFKNKPYSYKSDIWALGCILYELTTLNHAFDANSLNGLATKIVKGKYPPISNKYSKHLRDLITQMLMLNPQQRPDIDQILRKPFIKKHIVNFFVDIYSRPSTSIGEGTMILKAAAGGGGASVMNDQSMINFRQQLQQLDMMDMVQEALRPKEKPQDDQEAIRQAKEQASALKREQEHKKMVEAALEKLRQERELRARQRGVPVPAAGSGGARVPAAAAAAAPSAAGAVAGARRAAPPSMNPSPSNVPAANNNANRNDPYAGRREAKDASPASNANVRDRGFNWDQRPIRGAAAGGGAGVAAAGAADYLPPSRYEEGVGGGGGGGRRRSFEDAQNKAVGGSERDRVERDRRAAEERRRLIQEQEAAAAAAKARVEEQRRRDREEAKAAEAANIARAKAAAAAAEAEAERARVEALAAKEKAEQASRARRDVQRERERERQRLEIEQLKRDKLELDRRTQEREKMREDRRTQEQSRMDAVRREQMDAMQEKLDFMNDQIQKLDINPVGGRRGAAAGGGYVPSMAEEKSSGSDMLSARERAYFRRDGAKGTGAKGTEEEEEDNAIGRRSRALAAAQQQAGMKESGSNASVSSNNSSGNNSNSNYIGRNQRPGYGGADPAPQVVPGEFSPPPVNRYSYAANAAASGAGANSDSDEDDMFVAKQPSSSIGLAAAASNAEEEEEDLVRREEELRAELNFATMRCEELKRTLQETKSFLGPRLPTRGRPQAGVSSAIGGARPSAPPASVAALGGGGIAVVEDDGDNFEEDEDDFLTEDEYEVRRMVCRRDHFISVIVTISLLHRRTLKMEESMGAMLHLLQRVTRAEVQESHRSASTRILTTMMTETAPATTTQIAHYLVCVLQCQRFRLRRTVHCKICHPRPASFPTALKDYVNDARRLSVNVSSGKPTIS